MSSLPTTDTLNDTTDQSHGEGHDQIVHWTVAQVCQYVSGLVVDGHTFTDKDAVPFHEEAITGKLFLNLSKSDLNTLAMDHFSKRNALYRHIQNLKCHSKESSRAISVESLPLLHVGTFHSAQGGVTGVTSVSLPNTHLFAAQPWNQPILKSNPVLNLGSPNMTAVFDDIEQQLADTQIEPDSMEPSTRESDVKSATTHVSHSILQDCAQLNLSEIRVEGQFVDFPAVYQGANLHQKVFVLMAHRHVKELNQLYSSRKECSFSLQRPPTALQDFGCSIHCEKVPHGWKLGVNHPVRMPFNTLVRCRLDLTTDKIVDIGRVTVSGRIKHINDHGTIWVTSDLEMEAIEQRAAKRSASPSKSLKMVSEIVSVEMTDLSNMPPDNERCSYMVHDPERLQQQMVRHWREGIAVHYCLKVSTRTNQRVQAQRKHIFIQAWDVRLA